MLRQQPNGFQEMARFERLLIDAAEVRRHDRHAHLGSQLHDLPRLVEAMLDAIAVTEPAAAQITAQRRQFQPQARHKMPQVPEPAPRQIGWVHLTGGG